MLKFNESLHNHCRENDLYHIDQNAATTGASALDPGVMCAGLRIYVRQIEKTENWQRSARIRPM